MTPAQKEQWIKALRSGNYPQCHGQYMDGKGYCCLAVAGEAWGTYRNTNWDEVLRVNKSIYVGMKDTHKMSFKEIANFVELNE